VNYITQLNNLSQNEDRVQQIIEKIENECSLNDSSILDEEMCKQSNNFQSRLRDRKKKISNNQSLFNFDDLDKKKRYSMFLNKLSAVNLNEFVNNSKENNNSKIEVKIIEKEIESKSSKSSQSSSNTINSDDESIISETEKNFEDNLDKFEIFKIKEFADLFSPIGNVQENISSSNTEDNFLNPAGDNLKLSDTSISLFKINENVKISINDLAKRI